LNLVINAEQALTQKSGGRLALSVRGEDGRVTLTVDDDGAGVPAEIAARLFTPLACAGDGRLGIGLSVARRLAQRYGGDVTHEQRSPPGARFTLTIPASP